MRKIIIALAFVLAATFANAQQVDTVKTDFKLSNAKEFLRKGKSGQWYILYEVRKLGHKTVEVYCDSEDFFDILAWKNHHLRKKDVPHWEVLYMGKEKGYRLERKDKEKNKDA